MELPQSVADAASLEKIPQTVAELSQELEATEASPYVISFGKYNDKLCEIENLQGNKGRKVLKSLKQVGMNIRSLDDFKKYNFTVKPISNDGDYKKLYSHLEADIELKELVVGDSERVFFFVIESEKVLCVIAIKASHLETKKVRR